MLVIFCGHNSKFAFLYQLLNCRSGSLQTIFSLLVGFRRLENKRKRGACGDAFSGSGSSSIMQALCGSVAPRLPISCNNSRDRASNKVMAQEWHQLWINGQTFVFCSFLHSNNFVTNSMHKSLCT